MISAKDLRDRIDILTVKPRDGPVAPLSDADKWDDYKTGVWCKVEYLNGREFWSAKAANSETSIRVIVRYRTDVTTDMAIRFNGKILDIESARPLSNNRCWTVIITKDIEPVSG